MEIDSTKVRSKVEAIRVWSIRLVNEGKAQETMNWDAQSPWHNSKYVELDTKREWVIYLADQAWPGEVKVLRESGNAP